MKKRFPQSQPSQIAKFTKWIAVLNAGGSTYVWRTKCPPVFHREVIITKSDCINRGRRLQLFPLSWSDVMWWLYNSGFHLLLIHTSCLYFVYFCLSLSLFVSFLSLSPSPLSLFLIDLVQPLLGHESCTVPALLSVKCYVTTADLHLLPDVQLYVFYVFAHRKLTAHSSPSSTLQVFHAGNVRRGGRSGRLLPLCSLV